MLGSGSAGNATLLAGRDGRLLIDAGLSCREIVCRLEALGVDPASVGAVVLTHAHGDHVRGVGRLSKIFGMPVYATAVTRGASLPATREVAFWEEISPGGRFELCGFGFRAFTVPHDAIETLAFRIETPEGAVGFATDLGTVTTTLVERFADCVLLVLEANYAAGLLRFSPYAAPVRARIAGGTGHLSNEALAAFLAEHLGPGVRCVVLAHLSRVNNVPEIAEMTCREALAAAGRSDVRLVMARQDRASETIDLAAWPGVPVAPAPPERWINGALFGPEAGALEPSS